MPKILKNPIFLIFITVITIIFYISLAKTEQKAELTSSQVNKIAQENKELSGQIQVLEQKLQNSNQEKIIRDEFLMQKPGEYVVKVPNPPEESSEKDSENSTSHWKKWLKLLLK